MPPPFLLPLSNPDPFFILLPEPYSLFTPTSPLYPSTPFSPAFYPPPPLTPHLFFPSARVQNFSDENISTLPHLLFLPPSPLPPHPPPHVPIYLRSSVASGTGKKTHSYMGHKVGSQDTSHNSLSIIGWCKVILGKGWGGTSKTSLWNGRFDRLWR